MAMLARFFAVALLLGSVVSSSEEVEGIKCPRAPKPTRAPSTKKPSVRASRVKLPLVVSTPEGLVEGALLTRADMSGNVRAWKGLRYAKPPVGALRWADPQSGYQYDAANASYVYNATFFRPSCLQTDDFAGHGLSEDCLFLNIIAPTYTKDPSQGFPVLFFIHGGGFTSGSGGNPTFDGSAFARRGVVVVTFNYRLNIFGFLKNLFLSGNYGIKDQLLALKWVKANIANFGGNPDNITIAGHSSGGLSVAALLVNPLAAGLFQRAIFESANLGAPWTTPAIAKYKSDVLFFQISQNFSLLGLPQCANPLCFASLPASLYQHFIPIWSYATYFQNFANIHALDHIQSDASNPCIDPALLPLQPLEAFKSGQWNKVPFFSGTVEFEGNAFVYGSAQLYDELDSFGFGLQLGLNKPQNTSAEYLFLLDVFIQKAPLVRLNHVPSSKALEVAAVYPFTSTTTDGRDLFSEIFTDVTFRCSTRNVTNSNPFPSYLYEFDYLASTDCAVGSIIPECIGKACHSADTMFVFNAPQYFCGYYTSLRKFFTPSEADRDLASDINLLWSNFIKTGVPGLNWQPHTAANKRLQYLEASQSPLEDPIKSARCDYWDRNGYFL